MNTQSMSLVSISKLSIMQSIRPTKHSIHGPNFCNRGYQVTLLQQIIMGTSTTKKRKQTIINKAKYKHYISARNAKPDPVCVCVKD